MSNAANLVEAVNVTALTEQERGKVKVTVGRSKVKGGAASLVFGAHLIG
jgi:hypothetical protein